MPRPSGTKVWFGPLDDLVTMGGKRMLVTFANWSCHTAESRHWC